RKRPNHLVGKYTRSVFCSSVSSPNASARADGNRKIELSVERGGLISLCRYTVRVVCELTYKSSVFARAVRFPEFHGAACPCCRKVELPLITAKSSCIEERIAAACEERMRTGFTAICRPDGGPNIVASSGIEEQHAVVNYKVDNTRI